MWKPLNLTLRNFRSFQEQSYDFKTGAFLIQGINNTDEGSASNGSGKSSLREALCYCLNLSVLTETNTDLINNNSDECSVSFTTKNEKLNQELYVERITPHKGSSQLIIKLNGENQKDKFATVPEGNKLIIDFLGISKEDLLNYFIISKEKFISFFNSPDSKVKELIGRFSNFNRIDGVEGEVNKEVDKLNSTLITLNSSKDRLSGKIEILREQLEKERSVNVDEVKNSLIQNYNNQIAEYEKQVKHAKGNIENIRQAEKLLNDNLIKEQAVFDTYNNELIIFKGVQFDKEIETLNQSKNNLFDEKGKLNSATKELNIQYQEFIKFQMEVETAIAGSIQCPKCLHEFIPNSEMNIEEAKKTLPQVLEEIESVKELIKSKEKEQESIHNSIDEIESKLEHYSNELNKVRNLKNSIITKISNQENIINDIKRNLSKVDNEIKSFEDSITNFKNSINKTIELIEEVKQKQIETRVKEIEEQLLESDKELEEFEESIQHMKDDIFNEEQWVFRFKKFRSYLANESLEIIQGYANMYLQKMKTNLSIQLEGYKTNKDGSIREKITPIILRDGEIEGTGNYKKYSGGERGKIDFAIIVGLQNLINNSCETGGFDLLFVDEVLESVDSKGLELLVESVKDLNKTCLIVSHVQHNKVHENILTVEKNFGISKIV